MVYENEKYSQGEWSWPKFNDGEKLFIQKWLEASVVFLGLSLEEEEEEEEESREMVNDHSMTQQIIGSPLF